MVARSNTLTTGRNSQGHGAGERPWATAADYLLGLRAWGLILYGVLPANLALLGLAEVKPAKGAELNLLLPVSFAPVLLTFLLIRGRHREWYLTTDYLNLRSAFHTLAVLALTMLVFGLSGLVQGKYKYVGPVALAACDFSGLLTCEAMKGPVEAYLFGVGCLVLSSTLFMTVLTKGGDLPGLPTGEFTKQLGTIRERLRRVLDAAVWREEGGDCRKEVAEEAKSLLGELRTVSGNRLAKRSVRRAEEDLQHFIEAALYIEGDGRVNEDEVRAKNWVPYFAPPERLSEKQKQERQRKVQACEAIERLKRLKLGG